MHSRTCKKANMEDKDGAPIEVSSTDEPKSLESTPHLRNFSWSYWLFLTTIVASLAFYFVRRIGQVKKEAVNLTSLLDARIGFTPADAYETLGALGPKGRKIYKEINRVDFILAPIAFREYLLNTFPATSPRSDLVREALANTYFLGDVLENVCIAIMLKTYPTKLDFFAWASCVGNILKSFGMYLGILSVLYEVYVYLRGSKVKTQ
jgi:hypothetical protein